MATLVNIFERTKNKLRFSELQTRWKRFTSVRVPTQNKRPTGFPRTGISTEKLYDKNKSSCLVRLEQFREYVPPTQDT